MSFLDLQYAPLTRALNGRILELGCGRERASAIDLANARLVAVDQSPAHLQTARRRESPRSSGRVDFVTASGETLPFPDHSFDAIIGSFVFCSVGDVDRVAAELARVARPSATIVLAEHVRSGRPVVARLQDAVTPAYARLFRNCHLNRSPLEALRAHGFEISEVVRRGSVLPWIVFTGTRSSAS